MVPPFLFYKTRRYISELCSNPKITNQKNPAFACLEKIKEKTYCKNQRYG